ncbi:uncharacterized protein [Palaemon carinicauda]|uniref:uncharacterized protein n=1 Tax=Palaemon carinicauda TaxID=392227 RepID=UPI0035B60FF2
MVLGSLHFLTTCTNDNAVLDRFQKSSQENPDDASSFLYRMEGPLYSDDPLLLQLTKERFLIPPSIKPYSLMIDNGTDFEYSMYRVGVISWIYLNQIITSLFHDQPPGFFVEAGALDGEFLSNTLDLERFLGWTGLLVEVDEDLFYRLRKKNRKAWTSNTCLATLPYPHRTTLVKFANQALKEHEFSLYSRVYNTLIGSRDLEDRMGHGMPTYQTSQCLPLETLLLAINVTHVHLMVLDVEGVETEVLDSFFRSKVRKVLIDVWMVEHKHPEAMSGGVDRMDLEFVHWFHSKGYTLYAVSDHLPPDYTFIRNGSDIYEKAFASRPSQFNWKFEDLKQKENNI